MLTEGSMGFFSDHDVYGTNAHGEPRNLNRLDCRFDHIVKPHLEHIRGKRVLDLAAHDGHWSWAALQSGASFVRAVEGRPELVERARSIFEDSGIDRERWEISAGDIFDVLENTSERFDTIFCLGVFYHILDHHRLLRLMARLKPEAIILDTAATPESKPLIRLLRERTAESVNAIPREEGQTEAVIGTVSRGGIVLLAEEVGYTAQFVPWDFKRIDDHSNLKDYKKQRRVTVLLTPATSRVASASF